MLFFVVSLSFVVVAFGFCVWFLVKDRNFWRNEYRARDQEARQREQHLFDQMLRIKGFRATSEPTTPQPAVARAPVLDSEDLAIIDDRINERVEAGIVTPSEGYLWASQIRNGNLKPAELDRIFWKRQQNQFPGSVADID